MSITTRPISPEQTHPLRRAILRPHQTLAEMVYPHDDEPTTVHFGSFVADDTGERLCGIVTLAINPHSSEHAPGLDAPGLDAAWQLRGMATTPEVRGLGAGKALVLACFDHVKHQSHTDARDIWCNARGAALGFYERMGFEVVSEAFDIPGIGPHRVMVWPPPPHEA